MTLHLTEVEDPRAFGCVPTDEHGRVTAFLEKTPDPVTNQVNAGCYVFRRSVIDAIPAGRPVSVERETFPGLIGCRRPRPGPRRDRLLARPRHARRLRARVVRPGARRRRVAPPCPGRPGSRCCCPARRSTRRRRCPAARRSAPAPGSRRARWSTAACCSTVRWCRPARPCATRCVGEGSPSWAPGAGWTASSSATARSVGEGSELAAGARVWCDAELPAYLRFSPTSRLDRRTASAAEGGRLLRRAHRARRPRSWSTTPER